jgi:hypothetical protein
VEDAASTPGAGRATSLDGVLARIEAVDGWMTDDQAERLWGRAQQLAPGDRVVEIGSFRGRSAIVLASAAPDGVEVVAVDPHGGTDRGPNEIRGYEAEGEEDNRQFRKNLENAGVADRVTHLRMYSDAALGEIRGPVALLYIDGAHRFGPARADIRTWSRRLPVGGSMLLHDCFSSIGVTLAVLVELLASGRFRYVGRSGSLVEYRRRDLGARGRLRNVVRQGAQLPWFLRNVLIKLLITVRLGRLTRYFGHESGDWPN